MRTVIQKKTRRAIIFYAPLGKNTPPGKIGGAEAGCLKTKAIYEKSGINVIALDKPAVSKGIFRFVVEMALVPLKLFFLCVWTHKKTPIHIVGFYTKIVKFEWLLMKIAQCCGHKVIYELRNGSMISTYEEGNDKYRRYLRELLILPEVVLCQGMEYVNFIKENWGIERSYYPNYIMDEFLADNTLNRSYPIKLIYFGRVTESKHIDLSINILTLLRKSGIDAKLDIIGGYSEDYKSYLDNVVRQEDVEAHVTFYGRKPFDFIVERLRQSHYFLFPSTEKQEGHSNSLTEAMGCGVVPIVSKAGFNVSICGCEDLVVDGINPQDYADKILGIQNSGRWKYYSDYVYERIVNNFTESIVGENLISTVKRLYEES